jgi:two-component system phosphate regulon response regulator PhoB
LVGTPRSIPPRDTSSDHKPYPTVLLFLQDDAIRRTIIAALTPDWIEVICAEDGRSAEKALDSGNIEAVVLGTSNTDTAGRDTLKRIRNNRETENIPVLVLAEGADYERIVSLELGADDCLLPPFIGREIWLRVRSLLRRSANHSKPPIIQSAEFHFDPIAIEVRVLGKPVHLTGTEFKLLSLLMRRPGVVVEKDTLSRSTGRSLDYRTINTHMRRLRKKLGPIGEYLQSIRSVGYRLNWRSSSGTSAGL